MDINLLTQKINMLKNDIQDIILSGIDTDVDDTINEIKNNKIIELDNAINNLKKLKLEKNYNKICRENDSIRYYRVKNKSNSIELMIDFKDKREKAKEEYQKIQDIKSLYEINDPKELPGYLFFDKNVINAYNLCPYINIDENQDTDEIKNNRNEWLKNTIDNGEVYFKLRDKIINESEYNNYIIHKERIENSVNEIHDTHLSESQKQILEQTIEYINDFKNCTIKTKKIKEKFKIIINNISNLVIETRLNINEYLTLKYKLFIPINQFESKSTYIINECVINSYQMLIDNYTENNDLIESSQKYIKNTKINLKELLYKYFVEQESKLKEHQYKQIGKYHKKWTLLSDEEKHERFDSFSIDFVHKFLILSKLIDISEIDNMTNLLKDTLKDTNISVKDIKWNIKMGIIEKIHSLKYNDTLKKFSIINIIEKEKNTKKKPSSIKTIFNKDNEKIINELIVLCILKNKDKEVPIKQLKEDALETVKDKLKLKRITINDKIQINKIFDDIHFVINNSK